MSCALNVINNMATSASTYECFYCNAAATHIYELPWQYGLPEGSRHTDMCVPCCPEHIEDCRYAMIKYQTRNIFIITKEFLEDHKLTDKVFTLPNLEGDLVEGTIEPNTVMFCDRKIYHDLVVVLIGNDGIKHNVMLEDLVGGGLELKKSACDGNTWWYTDYGFMIEFNEFIGMLSHETVAYYEALQPETILI